LAEFAVKMQFVTVGEEEDRLHIPPPSESAEFPVKTQLVTVGEEYS